MQIVFKRKKTTAKMANVLVRFDPAVDEELRQIADNEDAYLVDVIRTFTEIGLEAYRKQIQEDINGA